MRTAIIVVVTMLGACQHADVSRELGARCASSAECDDRCLAESARYPGGFCTTACTADADCPGETSCVERDGGVCLFGCAAAADCAFLGAGWACQELDARARPDVKVKVCSGD